MNRTQFNLAIVPGLLSFAVEAFRPRTAAQEDWREWSQYCGQIKTSNRAYEEMAYFAGLGTVPVKPEGEPIATDDFVQGPKKRWTHVTYGLGTTITEELIEDALYPEIPTEMRQFTEELGISARETMNLLWFDVLNSGTGTSTHTTGEGIAIFSASHTRLRGGTWSNLLSPAADVSATALQNAIRQFETIRDDSGKFQRIRVAAVGCNPEQEWKFRELLESGFDPESPNNAINPIRSRGLRLLVSPYYTDTDAFTLFARPPHANSGIITFLRRPVRFARDGDFLTGDARFKVTFRHSVEVNKPLTTFHSAGA